MEISPSSNFEYHTFRYGLNSATNFTDGFGLIASVESSNIIKQLGIGGVFGAGLGGYAGFRATKDCDDVGWRIIGTGTGAFFGFWGGYFAAAVTAELTLLNVAASGSLAITWGVGLTEILIEIGDCGESR